MFNIYKKFLFGLLLLIFIGNTSFASNCNLFLERENCDKITSSSFNEFNLENTFGLSNFEAELYHNLSTAYKIPVVVDSEKIIQQAPFTIAGEYVLDVTGYDLAGNDFNFKFNILFDNSIPLPPLVPIELISQDGTVAIQGKVNQPNIEIVVEDINQNELRRTTSNSDGNFSFILNDLNPVHLLTFHTIGSNQRVSQSIQRVVLSSRSQFKNLGTTIEIDNLANTNLNTVKIGENYTTTKREFYVSGSSSGDFIYVNGVKTPVISGRFGTFVHLNEGQTQIFFTGKDIEKNVTLNYFDIDFLFTDIDFPQITTSSNINVEIKTNIALDYFVYLNGKVVGEETGDSTVSLSDLLPGRNSLTIVGPFGKIEQRYIFLDTQTPEINVRSREVLSTSSDFVFTIDDDGGLDLSSLEVTFGPFTITSGEIDRKGDFFYFSLETLEGLTPGTYNIEIKVSDIAQREGTSSFSLVVSDEITQIVDFLFEEGYFLGDTLFFKDKNQKITLIPNKNIAFKNINIDGKDVVNYSINLNNNVLIEINLPNSSGEIEFTYIDATREEKSYTYKYHVFDKNPSFIINSISSLFSKENIVIYGEVIGDHFDWSSFDVSQEANIFQKGNFVEIYINSLTTPNLRITGQNAGNLVLDANFGSLFRYIDNLVISLDSLNSNSIGGSLNILPKTYGLLYTYDSFISLSTLLGSNFELPASSRFGIRSAKFTAGFGNVYQNQNSIILNDGHAPIIYYLQNNSEKFLILDGTGSNIDRTSLNLTIDSNRFTSFSYCDEKIIPFGNNYVCILLPSFEDEIFISVSDLADNYLEKTYFKNDFLNFSDFTNNLMRPSIYVTGTDKISETQIGVVQGTHSSSLLSLEVQGGEMCDIDSTNFVCSVSLSPGDNPYTLIPTYFDFGGFSGGDSPNLGLYSEINLTNGQGVTIEMISEGVYTLTDTFGDSITVGNEESHFIFTNLFDEKYNLLGPVSSIQKTPDEHIRIVDENGDSILVLSTSVEPQEFSFIILKDGNGVTINSLGDGVYNISDTFNRSIIVGNIDSTHFEIVSLGDDKYNLTGPYGSIVDNSDGSITITDKDSNFIIISRLEDPKQLSSLLIKHEEGVFINLIEGDIYNLTDTFGDSIIVGSPQSHFTIVSLGGGEFNLTGPTDFILFDGQNTTLIDKDESSIKIVDSSVPQELDLFTIELINGSGVSINLVETGVYTLTDLESRSITVGTSSSHFSLRQLTGDSYSLTGPRTSILISIDEGTITLTDLNGDFIIIKRESGPSSFTTIKLTNEQGVTIEMLSSGVYNLTDTFNDSITVGNEGSHFTIESLGNNEYNLTGPLNSIQNTPDGHIRIVDENENSILIIFTSIDIETFVALEIDENTAGVTIIENADGSLTLTDDNGNSITIGTPDDSFTIINRGDGSYLISGPADSIIDNGDGTFTIIDENGNSITIGTVGDGGGVVVGPPIDGNITYPGNNTLFLEITSLGGSGIFMIGSQYYYLGGELIINLNGDEVDVIKVLANNRVYDANLVSNSINLNLAEVISDSDYKEIFLKIEGENSEGETGSSNIIFVIYQRIIQTLVSVIVG